MVVFLVALLIALVGVKTASAGCGCSPCYCKNHSELWEAYCHLEYSDDYFVGYWLEGTEGDRDTRASRMWIARELNAVFPDYNISYL